MAAEVLSIELQAKVDQFIAGLLAAANETKVTGSSVDVMTASISKNIANVNKLNLNAFQNALKSGQLSIKGFENATKTIPNALPKITAGSNQAAMALTNLGRVAQDAPFGFIGIQNNLNPLLESFQRLRAESGSNREAFKALGQSLIGPAGLGIALSLITAAITFYVQWQQKAAREAEAAAKALSKQKDALKEYEDGLKGVERAQLKGEQNAQKDLISLRLLYEATQNLKLPTDERILAAKKLQEQYPKTFSNFTTEQILLGETSKMYKNLAQDILAVAKAAASQDILIENEKKLITLNKQRDTVIRDRITSERQLAKFTDVTIRAAGGAGVGAANSLTSSERERLDINARLVKIKKDENDLTKQIQTLTNQNIHLERDLTKEVEKRQSVTGLTGIDTDKGKTAKDIKTISDVMKELAIDLQQVDAEFNLTFGEKANKKIDSYQKAIGDLISIGYDPATEAVLKLKKAQQDLFQLPQLKTGTALDPKTAPRNRQGNDKGVIFERVVGDIGSIGRLSKEDQALAVEYATILEKQDKFNADFQKGFENLQSASIAEAIGGGFSAIGEAMVSGGNIIEAAGSALMGTLSQFLNELGGMLVKKGLATVLAGTALNFLFPGQGAKTTAGGFALIAAGAALSLGSGVISGIGGKGSSSTNNNSNVTAFANGGIISGPTLGLMGEYSGAKTNPEVVAPLNKLKSMLGDTSPRFEVIQYIEGDKLAVMVRNSNQRTGRI